MSSQWTRPVVWLCVATAAGWLAWSAASEIGRRGYVLDEELTTFAARGIGRDGLPTLPSGAMYERGLPYSYVAALAGFAAHEELQAYRLASLVLGALAIVIVFVATRSALGDIPAALTASWLVALSPSMVTAAAWARFYSMATLAIAAALAAFFSPRGRLLLFPIVVAIASLVHEATALLIVLPVTAAVVQPDVEHRRSMRRMVLLTLAALGAGRLLLLGLHFLVPNQAANPWLTQPPIPRSWLALPGPPLPDVAGPIALIVIAVAQGLLAWWFSRRERLGLALLLPSAAFATFFHLGLLIWWALAVALLMPERTRGMCRHVAAALVLAIGSWWIVFSVRHIAPFDVNAWRSFVALGFVIPTDAVRFVAGAMPGTVILLLACGVLAAVTVRSPASVPVRIVLSFLMAMVAAFSFLDISPSQRHLLLMLPGIAFVLAGTPLLFQSRLQRHPSRQSPMWRAGLNVAVLLLVVADWQGLRNTFTESPRFDLIDRASIRTQLDTDTIITNDDVASVFELGRADYWYAESSSDREKYTLHAPSGPISVYSGASLVATPAALRDQLTACAASNGCLLAVFRTGRFPYGGFEQFAQDFIATAGGVELLRTPSMTLTHVPASHHSR